MRSNFSPSAGSTIVDKLKPYEGGLGVTDAASARTAVGVMAASVLGQPNGVAKLGTDGLLPATAVPDDGIAPIGVQGANSVTISTTNTYTITNYDIFTAYTLTPIGTGTVSRNGSVITYNAPATGEAGGFTLNGRAINVTVIGAQPNAPVLSAVDVVSGVGAAFQCTGSAYSVNMGSFTHLNSDWQVASDAAFTTIVSQALADATNKTAWKSDTLNVSTTYYARVRYRDSTGTAGGWSNVVSITTKASYAITIEEARPGPSELTNGDQFGWSTSMSADGIRLAVGAAAQGSGIGAVYVFTRTGTSWVSVLKITPGTANNYFGSSVSLTADGTRLAVGAWANNSKGKGYIYLRTGTTWNFEANIDPAGTATSDSIGRQMAISADGTRCIIGAINNAGNTTNSGAAWVFSRSGTTWTEEAKLLPEAVVNQYFGYSVSLTSDGTRACVGALNGTDGTGAIYIYLRTGTSWTLEQKITGASVNSGAINGFGRNSQISADGIRIVTSSYNAAVNGTGSGAVYVFVRSGVTWTQEARFDGVAGSYLGQSVAINADGSRAVAGAPSGNGRVTNTGVAFIYNRAGSTWNQEGKIQGSDSNASDNYGIGGLGSGTGVCITADGSRVAVGAIGNDPSSKTDAGAVYIYR